MIVKDEDETFQPLSAPAVALQVAYNTVLACSSCGMLKLETQNRVNAGTRIGRKRTIFSDRIMTRRRHLRHASFSPNYSTALGNASGKWAIPPIRRSFSPSPPCLSQTWRWFPRSKRFPCGCLGCWRAVWMLSVRKESTQKRQNAQYTEGLNSHYKLKAL